MGVKWFAVIVKFLSSTAGVRSLFSTLSSYIQTLAPSAGAYVFDVLELRSPR